MRVPCKGGLTPEAQQAQFEFRLRVTLSKIQKTIGASDEDFRDILQISTQEYNRAKRSETPYSTESLWALASFLNLNVNLLLSGNVDYNALRLRFKHNVYSLPERYSNPAQQLARVRAVQSMLGFVTLQKGASYVDRILSRLQVGVAQLGSSHDFTSPLLGIDILKNLQAEGFNDDELREMGKMTLIVARGTSLGKGLSIQPNASTLYRTLFEEYTESFDQVWRYKLVSITNESCTIEITSKESSEDIFCEKKVGNRQVCLFLQGVFSSMLGHIDPRPPKLQERECMYLDGHRCVYEISWA